MFSTFVLEQEAGGRFLTGLGHSLSDWASRSHVLLLTVHSKWDENQVLYPEGYLPTLPISFCLETFTVAWGKGASALPVKRNPDHSPELLALRMPGTHAHTRVPTGALASVNVGFLLTPLFILPRRVSRRGHSSSRSAARLHAAIVPCSQGAVLGCGCSSRHGKPGSLSGQAPLPCPPTFTGFGADGECCSPSLSFTGPFKHHYSK